MVNIKGRGTILFACADGEHRALTDVYYIPQLRSNIVSLGSSTRTGATSRSAAGTCTCGIGVNDC